MIDDAAKTFIEEPAFFFLSTVNESGHPTVSYKGGAPGFVRVLDPATLVFPSYDGNGMFLSMGNLLTHPRVGILFIDFERPNRLRLNGTASIDQDDPLMDAYHEAQFVVRVAVRQLFPNCPRYIPRFQRVDDSPHVPKAGCETPFANWKQIDFVRDALPEKDLKKVDELPAITIEEFLASIK